MREAILVDGRPVDPEQGAVRPLDPGLLGQGVYESIRTYDRVPFALERHLDRLAAGARALDIDCPVAALAAEVGEAVVRLAPAGEARIRIVLTAGGTRVVSADALPDRSGEREQGISAVSLPWPRLPGGPTEGVKASSTAASRVGLAHARAQGADTGLWLTPDGRVQEALAANVFALVDGTLVTPPLADGALGGVTRAELLGWAAEDGIPVAERSLPRTALAAAPEAFVSATSEPVVPLVQLDGAPLGGGAPGPLTRRLQELFERRARAAVAARHA
jgi:branched-subunit amino acid aminotransferase/4-amino-4-deoxychorismate lyase